MASVEDDNGPGPSSNKLFFAPAPETTARPARRRSGRKSLLIPGDDQDDSGSDYQPEPSQRRAVQSPTSDDVRESLNRTALEVLAANTQKKKRISKPRISGGRPATNKPIRPDYDTEDQTIITMKQAGYADQDVVDRLIQDGLTAYEPKSISSRWQRMRKCLQAAEEELFDEDLTDWHEGEDDHLADAVDKARVREAAEIEKIHAKFYKFVAFELNKKVERPRFSARTCKERHEAIQAGTARVPIELDPDPAARAKERMERIEAFKLRKQQEAEATKEEAQAKKKAKSQTDQHKETARQKREDEAIVAAQKKKEEAEFKKLRSTAAAERRKNREENRKFQKARRLYDQRKLACEKKLLKVLKREANERARALTKFSGCFPLPESAKALEHASTVVDAASTNDKIVWRSAREEALRTIDFAQEEIALNERLKTQSKIPVPKVTPIHQSIVNETAIFGEDPRMLLTLAEIYDCMRDRGMLLGRMKEVKAVAISRIHEDDHVHSLEYVQELCDRAGIQSTGTKDELTRRLAEQDARQSSKYKRMFAPKKPAKEAALARIAAKAANGGKALPKGRLPKPASERNPSRFSALHPSKAPGLGAKRYSAVQKTNEITTAAKKRAKSIGPGVSKSKAVPKTPVASKVPNPTYAVSIMQETGPEDAYATEYEDDGCDDEEDLHLYGGNDYDGSDEDSTVGEILADGKDWRGRGPRKTGS